MSVKKKQLTQQHVGVIGGGIAGVTAAIKLLEMGVSVSLFDKKPGLVYGPPICHLHAGGNLYRDISEHQCVELLRQSIDSVRLYPHTINVRPTVITVPLSDDGDPNTLLPRLAVIQASYQALVRQDSANQVLGAPEEYYKLYTRDMLEWLQDQQQPQVPACLDDWMIPFAQQVDLDTIKFPVVLVQEYGWSLFRLAASAQLLLEHYPNNRLFLASEVTGVEQAADQWQISFRDSRGERTETVDYLINACGFETGIVDNWVDAPRDRLVEFKAAYVTHWSESHQLWPEVIFHGPRGTVDGMAQLTPYADGVFQLHGMTEDITLFHDGLVANEQGSSQPELPAYLMKKLVQGWSEKQQTERTELAIRHMSRFIPAFSSATAAGKPLFGAQQVPGTDVTLRAADVSFVGDNYARIEIVKGSSAIEAASKVVSHLIASSETSDDPIGKSPVSRTLDPDTVEALGISLTQARGYPTALAKRSGV